MNDTWREYYTDEVVAAFVRHSDTAIQRLYLKIMKDMEPKKPKKNVIGGKLC